MNRAAQFKGRFSDGATQRGVALVVALILLVVATLIGLAGIRGVNLQERMSANMYDRSLAFQRAEAALRAAEDAIAANPDITALSGLDCSPESGNVCDIVPAKTFTSTDATWIDVNSAHNVNSDSSPGTPQYQIQFMGNFAAESVFGLEANADYGNYGNVYPPDDVAYYRITARSANPQLVGERAIVVLQTTVRRPI